MHIFFCDQPADKEFFLDQVESNHLSRVLRLKAGDHVAIINGDGNLYNCLVTDIKSKGAVVGVVSVDREYDSRNYYLHIAIAPTKSMERFEFFVEKSVELGIDEITPLITSRSERRSLRTDRISKIAISAMKQSLKAKKTIINEPVEINLFTDSEREGQKFIAHCIDNIETQSLGKLYNKAGKITILIGPEGDFTPGEVIKAVERGYRPVNLGKSRLRTETAGIAACSQVYFINQE